MVLHPLGTLAQHPSACSHPGVSPQFAPVLRAEPLGGNQWGCGGNRAMAAGPVRLFSFLSPLCRVRRHRWTSKSECGVGFWVGVWALPFPQHWGAAVTLVDVTGVAGLCPAPVTFWGQTCSPPPFPSPTEFSKQHKWH